MYSDQQEIQGNPRFGPTAIAYDLAESKDKIKSALADMESEGFDFKYKNQPFEGQQYKQCSKLRHRSYLRHECVRCKENTNSKKQKLKRFTTSKGTVEFRYTFMKIKKFFVKFPSFKKKKQDSQQKLKQLKYPFVLLWDFYIYHMKCKGCTRRGRYSQQQLLDNPELVYAVPYIYEEILNQAIARFIFELKRRLEPNIYKKEKKSRHHMRVPPLRNHLKSLCEACKKGICQNFYADKNENNDGDSFLDSSSSESRISSSRSSQSSSSDQYPPSNTSSRPSSAQSSRSSNSSIPSNQSHQSQQSQRSQQSRRSRQSQNQRGQDQRSSNRSNQDEKQQFNEKNKKATAKKQEEPPKYIENNESNFMFNLKGQQLSLRRQVFEQKKSEKSEKGAKSNKSQFPQQSASKKSTKSEKVQDTPKNQKKKAANNQHQNGLKSQTSEKRYTQKSETKKEETKQKRYTEKVTKV